MTQFIRTFVFTLIVAITILIAAPAETASSTQRAEDAEQVRLDKACANAREAILSVERTSLVEECVTKKFPRSDRAGCERFYADHGAAAGGRAPLHMNLPECVEANNFRQNRSTRPRSS
jgi:hypothetical protein